MRFGLQIETPDAGDDVERMMQLASTADDVGFDSVWYEDHLSLTHADDPGRPWPQLECLTMLAAIAVRTDRIRIGSLVAAAHHRNPALLAKMFTTIDRLSRGRVIVGIGAGWHDDETAAYGYPGLTTSQRFALLEDTLQIVDRMLRGGPATYRGAAAHVDDARNDPPPLQRPRPPILVGGNGHRRTLRLVAEHADACNVFGSAAEVAESFRVLDRHCADLGRDPAEVTRTVNVWALLADSATDRQRLQRRYPQASPQSTQQLVDELSAYADAGAQVAIVKLHDAADIDPIHHVAETVLPALS